MENHTRMLFLSGPAVSMIYNRPPTFRTLLLILCRCTRTGVLFSILVLMPFVSSSVRAQGRITAIEKNLKPVKTTKEIKCIRFATLMPAPRVTVPMNLEVGDELIRTLAGMTVRVKCGTSADLVLSGRFHVRFLRSNERGCNIAYLSSGGEVSVRASAPTNIQSGETRLASRRTLYGIKSTRIKRGLTRQWLVYEGEVNVESQGFSATVTDGEKLVAKGAAAPSKQSITRQDVKETATALARVEVSQAKTSNPKDLKTAFLRLQTLHQAVLTDPKDEQKRLNLVNAQKSLGVPMAALAVPVTRESLVDLVNLGKYREAITGFDKRVSENRSDSSDHYWLAFAHEKLGDTESARLFARKALDLDKTDGGLSGRERESAARIAGLKTSAPGVKPAPRVKLAPGVTKPSVVTSTPATPRDEQAVIFELIRLGRYNEADAGFKQRIREKRENSRDYYGLALVHRKIGNEEDSITNARRALEVNGVDNSLSQNERVESEAIAASEQDYLFKLLRTSTRNAIAGFEKRIRENRFDSRDHYGLALGFQGLGDTLQSVDSALAALARNETDRRLSRDEQSECDKIASSELDHLFRLIGQRQFDEASERLQRRIREKRADSRHYYALALVREGLGITVQAIAHAQQALKVNSSDGQLVGKQYDDCVRIANTGNKTDIQLPEPKDEQAELFRLINQGMYKEAILGFDRRVQGKRENSRDYYGLALAYEFLKDAKATIRNAEQALRVNKIDQRLSQKEQLACLRMQGASVAGGLRDLVVRPSSEQENLFGLIKQGAYKDAAVGFQRRIQEKRHDSKDYYGLALCYEGLKDEKQAIVSAQQALKLTDSDRRLSKEEQSDCRRIAGGKER